MGTAHVVKYHCHTGFREGSVLFRSDAAKLCVQKFSVTGQRENNLLIHYCKYTISILKWEIFDTSLTIISLKRKKYFD